MRYLTILGVAVSFILSASGLRAQYFGTNTYNVDRTEAYTLDDFYPVNLIDLPTATILTETNVRPIESHWQTSMRMYESGGVLAEISVGLTRHLMFGASYGGQNVIGQGNIIWNESPGVHVRYRIFNQGKLKKPKRREGFSGIIYGTEEEEPSMLQKLTSMADIAIGFNSQGYGAYDIKRKRYYRKSVGLYLVMSRNWGLKPLNMGLHVGINRSQEIHDGDKDVNMFIGAHAMLEEELSALWEYDFAFNDNNTSFGAGHGYMNAAIRWKAPKNFLVEFAVKNISRNRKDQNGNIIPYTNREFKVMYRVNFRQIGQ